MIQYAKESGVSLVELVIVIIVVGVVATAFSSGFTAAARALMTNDPLQRGISYAEECAEHIMYIQRDPAQGFDAVVAAGSAICNSLPASTGLNRTVTFDAYGAYTPGTGICPTQAAACKSVTIDTTSSGATVGRIEFMLYK